MTDSELLDRLRNLESKTGVQIALLEATTKRQEEEIKNLKGGINRGLWMIGGGFISAFVAWVVTGGLSAK